MNADNPGSPWFTSRGERDDEIRRMWQQWYALPSWARSGITAAAVTLAACIYIAAAVIAAVVTTNLFGDPVGIATAVVGLAGFVGLLVALISATDHSIDEARKLRARRTGEKS